MGSELEIVEQRLNTFVGQIQTEFGILDRLVYKNKNQHRRCSYFQYLLKVRRDLRLLQAANLEEVLSASFQVLYGKRPKQKVQLLESLKRRRSNGGKFNFLERLIGVAHLLSQVSLFLSFLLLVLYLKPFICVYRVTHGIGLPVSTYHVSEDRLLAFTGINNLSPSPVLDDYLKLFYYALVFTYRKDSSVHKACAFMQDLGKCRTLRVMEAVYPDTNICG